MARRLITALLRLVVRVFFRKIEMFGDVPRDTPVIFAVNHPNALIDPLFLLCFAPRRVSFLAKAPLFRMPMIGWMVRALDTIPVYRRQDNAATASNTETFERAHAVLAGGGAIAIFPEGTTHSDPKLRELKTGVSRIALGASLRVSIIPTGLYYTSKHTFRSSALVYFGEPIVVEPQGDDPDIVNALTDRVEAALAEVTLQADSHEALDLIAHAERVFSGNEERSLAQEFELRKRFVEGYRYLCDRDPARLARLAAAVREIDAQEHAGGVTLSKLLFMLPGTVGAVVHSPVYMLIDRIARRTDREMASTVKMLGAMLLYPLWWLAIAIVFALRVSVVTGLAVFALLPILGYCAVAGAEAWDAFRARAPDAASIREEIIQVAKQMGSNLSL